jgi:putative DNA primase/helicase
VTVAFHAANLMAVARDVRRRYPAATLIMCADDDRATDGNPGLERRHCRCARGAAGCSPCHASADDAPSVSIDFNDVYRRLGAAAVRARIEEAAAPDDARAAEIGDARASMDLESPRSGATPSR